MLASRRRSMVRTRFLSAYGWVAMLLVLALTVSAVWATGWVR